MIDKAAVFVSFASHEYPRTPRTRANLRDPERLQHFLDDVVGARVGRAARAQAGGQPPPGQRAPAALGGLAQLLGSRD